MGTASDHDLSPDIFALNNWGHECLLYGMDKKANVTFLITCVINHIP